MDPNDCNLCFSNDKAKAYVKKYFERIREDVLEHSYGHVFQKDSIDFGVIYIQCVEVDISLFIFIIFSGLPLGLYLSRNSCSEL